MSMDANKAIAQRVYEILNAHDLDALDEVFAPDINDHNPDPDQAPGLAEIKKGFGALLAAFPDYRVEIEDMIAEGDKVVVRLCVTSSHHGEFMGVAPTGKTITYTGIDILRIVDGKVVDRWGEFDMLRFMKQLGLG